MRRTTLTLLILGLLSLPTQARAETAKEVIEKAIEAHGGADNLKKFTTAKATTKGKINLSGLEVTFEGESTYQLPDLGKNVLKLNVANMKIDVVQIYNAGKVKVTSGGMSPPLTDGQKNEIKESIHLQSVHLLVPLLKADAFTINLIENPGKVKDKEVDGVLVKSKGFRDAKLFFDKKTHVLVKIERQGLDPADKEVLQEMFLLDHKKFDGVLYSSKSELFMEGKKFMEAEVVDYKHLEKVDKKEFDVSD